MNVLKLFILSSLILLGTTVYAADSLSIHYPIAVLVQLNTEQSMIKAMYKNRDYKSVKEATNDAKLARQKMINDFTDNYHSSPVYYFIDTNADLIKDKHFQGVLLHADGTPIRKAIIDSNSSDYVVVYYGRFIYQQLNKDVVTDSEKYTYDPESPSGKGLVVLNDKFQQIDRFYKFGYDEILFSHDHKSQKKKYSYTSRHFSIEYYPFAHLFQENLGDLYTRHRIDPRRKDLK